jgi:predicted metallopeptidase
MVGFNFTLRMRHLCADMVTRLEALRHIDLDRVAIRYCQTRRLGHYGIHASLTPLRFAGGSGETRKHGRRYTVERIHDAAGREMLYLLSFYLPRFLDRPLADKLNTVIHELWHIGPEFNGDVRRQDGRCYAHTSSQKEYHAVIERLTAEWLALGPPADLFAFLRFDFRALTRLHGPVFGTRIPTPKLVPLKSVSD